MIIHTVYRPEENIGFIDDWLNHHYAIGVEHFYLYDNGGSVGNYEPLGHGSVPGITKYKYKFDTNNLDAIREKESHILKKYPVTKIMWNQKNDNGLITYRYHDSLINFSNIIDNGLCAFIDMDEFIIKNEEFKESRLFQKRFAHIREYNSVYDCYDACDMDTSKMDTKVIIDMSRFKKILNSDHGNIDPESYMHFSFLRDLPTTTNYYNHYNHNMYSHRLLAKGIRGWQYDPGDDIKKIKSYKDVFYKVDDHNLKKIF